MIQFVRPQNCIRPLLRRQAGRSGSPPGTSAKRHWSDLTAFHASGQGDSAGYNALPSYAGGKPLWQYASDPGGFVNAKSIFTCPTATAGTPEFNPLDRVIFNYGMNYKGTTGLPGAAYGINFSATAVLNVSAFVFLSDVRAHSTEKPFYGSNPANEVGCSHCWIAQISSRHNAGANLNFADGHVAWFKYTYVCLNTGTKAADPGRADINWTYNGQPVH